MASAFDKQQTAETLRAAIDLQQTVWDARTDDQRAADRAEYQAERTKRYKVRLINGWRRKQGTAK